MKISKLVAGLAALALVATPAVAKVTMSPAFAPLTGDEEGAAGAGGLLLAGLAAAAVVTAVVVASDSSETQLPVSP